MYSVYGFSQTFMIIIKNKKYSLIQMYKENDFFNKEILQEKERKITFKKYKFSLFASP